MYRPSVPLRVYCMNVKTKIRLLWLISAISYTLVFIIVTVNLFAPNYTPFGLMIAAILIMTGSVGNVLRWSYLRETKERGDTKG